MIDELTREQLEREVEQYVFNKYAISLKFQAVGYADNAVMKMAATAATLLGYTMNELGAESRERDLVDARYIVMVLINQNSKLTDEVIARLFNLDRSMMHNARKVFSNMMETNEAFKNRVQVVVNQLFISKIKPHAAKNPL